MRKLASLVIYWAASVFALVACSAVICFALQEPSQEWPPSAVFIFSLIFTAIVTTLNACGIGLALLLLPPIAPESAHTFKIASAALGVGLAIPIYFISAAISSVLSLGVAGDWWIAGPSSAAILYFVSIRVLIWRGWIAIDNAADGRCVGCGYILFPNKSDRCPECGRASIIQP